MPLLNLSILLQMPRCGSKEDMTGHFTISHRRKRSRLEFDQRRDGIIRSNFFHVILAAVDALVLKSLTVVALRLVRIAVQVALKVIRVKPRKTVKNQHLDLQAEARMILMRNPLH